jgi:DNA-binding transcriptional regulator LsrR (DeoR family)
LLIVEHLLIATVCDQRDDVPDDLTWDDHELLARIAQRSYVDGLTQEEIASEFGLSRPKVQRLLERARSTGVVKFHIEAPPGLNLELEARLRSSFALSDAIVAPRDDDPERQRASVARSAAAFLDRRLPDGTVVAVGHGRDTSTLPRYFSPTRRPRHTFVSAMGGSPRVDSPTNPDEISRSLAERCGGRAEILYAPAYVESAEMRDRLMAQEAVAHTLGVAARADVAIVGIGGTDDGCTMVRSGCLSLAEIATLRERGAVGDVLGNYVDIRGNVIDSPHSHRLVGLSLADLRRIDTVIAIVSEVEKPRAILGVLRAHVIDVLVVDEGNATTILELAQGGPAADPTPDATPEPKPGGGRPSGRRSAPASAGRVASATGGAP